MTSLEDVYNTNITALPLGAMFQQATRSNAGTFALLLLFCIDVIVTAPGAWIAAGRMLWTLGRDEATPFPKFVRHISPTWRNPFNAQIICCIVGTILGCIYIGSATAFNAFVAGFTIFTTMSYCAALLPHILTARKYVTPGPFWMKGIIGYIVMGTACAYILLFNVLYMFPYSYPVANAEAMNWTSVIFTGITVLLALGYLWKRSHGYVGPRVVMDAHDDILRGVLGLDEEVARKRKESGRAPYQKG